MAKVELMDKVTFSATRFGSVQVDENSVLTFVEEIPGFADAKRFVLIPHTGESPFAWLQCVDISELALVVVNPWLFVKDYEPEINEVDLDSLGIVDDNEKDIIVLSIVTIPGNPQKMTINLKAPVIINAENKKAKQVILKNDEYQIKHPVLQNK